MVEELSEFRDPTEGAWGGGYPDQDTIRTWDWSVSPTPLGPTRSYSYLGS